MHMCDDMRCYSYNLEEWQGNAEAIHTTSGKMLTKKSKTTYGKTNDTKVYFGYEGFFDEYTNIYKLVSSEKY